MIFFLKKPFNCKGFNTPWMVLREENRFSLPEIRQGKTIRGEKSHYKYNNKSKCIDISKNS